MSKSFRARSQRRQFRIRPTDLLLMASAASAISLSNFQFITSGSISLDCFFAYNTPLRGCIERDFGGGRTCSAFCMRAIERVTRDVQSACESFEPATNSLLDLTMSGRLLEVLCPNNGDDDDDATETTTNTKVSPTTCTADGPTTVQDTTKMHTICPSSSSPSSTAATADPPQGETTAPPPPPTGDGDVVIVTSTVMPAEPTEEAFDPLASGGGGSPFDPIQFSGAPGLPGRGLMGRWSLVFAVGSMAAFGI